MTPQAALVRRFLQPPPAGDRFGSRRVGLLAVSLVALGVALLGIDRPVPWGDEAATMLAVRRDWAGILPLAGGPETVLVPYYVLAKAFAAALPWLPDLVAVRVLSAVAAAITAGALYSIVVRSWVCSPLCWRGRC